MRIMSKSSLDAPSIPWAKPKFFGQEEAFVVDALRSSWISGGKYVERLEKEIAEHLGVRHSVAVSNGTTALELAFRAIGVGPGSEVIVPAFTFVAPVNMVISLGAKPVYADIDSDTWLIDEAQIESLITERTKAIVPVHLYGNVARMDAILDIAQRRGLIVVEDAAEAAFSRHKNKCAGAFGTVGTLSFHATKTVTTGEGGMVVTDDEAVAVKMRLLRDHGMNVGQRYWHDIVGYNFRLTNLQAALGCAQLLHLDRIIEARRRIHSAYQRTLQVLSGITLQRFDDAVDPVLWAMAIRINSDSDVDTARGQRDELMGRMALDGIETRPGFYSLNLLKPYGCPDLPIATRVSASVISLPTYIGLSDQDILRICSSLEKALRGTK
jgi:perosamine synthetase